MGTSNIAQSNALKVCIAKFLKTCQCLLTQNKCRCPISVHGLYSKTKHGMGILPVMINFLKACFAFFPHRSCRCKVSLFFQIQTKYGKRFVHILPVIISACNRECLGKKGSPL